MKQPRAPERRSGLDRRLNTDPLYAGPERRRRSSRRSGRDRRRNRVTVCTHCGQICGQHNGWSQHAATVEMTIEFRRGLCAECSAKRYPKFYTDS
jgi:hypothetical protein